MNRNERGDLTGWAFLFVVTMFLVLAVYTYNNPKNEEMGIQGGDIQKAVDTNQH